MLSKMSKVHADHPNFTKKCLRGTSMFTIVHYAGAVTYEIDGFLDKDKDPLHNDIAGCLRSSSGPFVRAHTKRHSWLVLAAMRCDHGASRHRHNR